MAVCREKMWPLLKNSTSISYDYHLDTYILPRWGSMRITKLRTIELQDFFNSFSPRLAPKTIRNMHSCLRAVLSQGKAWGVVRMKPCPRHPIASQESAETACCAEQAGYPPCRRSPAELTRSIVTLMVVGSLRIGEVAALCWERIHPTA